MGFISGTSTVTVQAKLTDAGKKKLYDSIELGGSGFVTKFAIGDSDANYAAIDAGTSVLSAGHVPEAGGFVPSLRSFALYKGQYRPGVPVILVNGEYGNNNGVSRDLSIAGNNPVNFQFQISTEWPKNTVFTEAYKLEVQNPGNLTQATIDRFFTVAPLTSGYAFQFDGGLSLSDVSLLAGAYASGNGTVIPVKITGRISGAQLIYNIRLIQ